MVSNDEIVKVDVCGKGVVAVDYLTKWHMMWCHLESFTGFLCIIRYNISSHPHYCFSPFPCSFSSTFCLVFILYLHNNSVFCTHHIFIVTIGLLCLFGSSRKHFFFPLDRPQWETKETGRLRRQKKKKNSYRNSVKRMSLSWNFRWSFIAYVHAFFSLPARNHPGTWPPSSFNAFRVTVRLLVCKWELQSLRRV